MISLLMVLYGYNCNDALQALKDVQAKQFKMQLDGEPISQLMSKKQQLKTELAILQMIKQFKEDYKKHVLSFNKDTIQKSVEDRIDTISALVALDSAIKLVPEEELDYPFGDYSDFIIKAGKYNPALDTKNEKVSALLKFFHRYYTDLAYHSEEVRPDFATALREDMPDLNLMTEELKIANELKKQLPEVLNQIEKCTKEKPEEECIGFDPNNKFYKTLARLDQKGGRFGAINRVIRAFGDVRAVIGALDEHPESLKKVISHYVDYYEQADLIKNYDSNVKAIGFEDLTNLVVKELSGACVGILDVKIDEHSSVKVNGDIAKNCLQSLNNPEGDKKIQDEISRIERELQKSTADLNALEQNSEYAILERFKYLLSKQYERECNKSLSCEDIPTNESLKKVVLIGDYIQKNENPKDIDNKLKELCKNEVILSTGTIRQRYCKSDLPPTVALDGKSPDSSSDNKTAPGPAPRPRTRPQPPRPDTRTPPPSDADTPPHEDDSDTEERPSRPASDNSGNTPRRTSNPFIFNIDGKGSGSTHYSRSFGSVFGTSAAAAFQTASPFIYNWMLFKQQNDTLISQSIGMRQMQTDLTDKCSTNVLPCLPPTTSYTKFSNESNRYWNDYLSVWQNYWRTPTFDPQNSFYTNSSLLNPSFYSFGYGASSSYFANPLLSTSYNLTTPITGSTN